MDRKVTGKFGEHRNYYSPGVTHQGVDLAYAMNEPFNAYAGGKVSQVGFDPNGYGNYIKIADDSGRTHVYGHANKVNKKVGDLVALNELLGFAGATGRATGPHVHYGVYQNGKAIDPMGIINGKIEVAKSVLGKPQNANIDTTDLVNSYAQELAQAQKTPPVPQLPTIDKELEGIMRNRLIQGVSPIEKPQFTTIEDIFNAKKGEKLNKFAEYMGTPEALQLVNGIVSLVSPTGRYGGSRGFAQNLAGEKQAAMSNLHNKIDTQNANGLDMTMDLFKELNLDKKDVLKLQEEIRNNDVTAINNKYNTIGTISDNKDKNSLQREQLTETSRHNQASESLEDKKIDAEKEKKATKEKEKKEELITVGRQLDAFEKTFQGLASERNSNPLLSKTQGILTGTSSAISGGNLRSNEASEFEAMRAPLVSIVARKIAGEKGNMSDRDIARAEKAVPGIWDSKEQRAAKMKGIRNLLNATTGETMPTKTETPKKGKAF